MPGPGAVAPSDERVAEVARVILDDPRYENFRPENFDVWRSALKRLFALLTWLTELRDTNPALYWLTLVVLLAACAALTAHVVGALRESLSGRPPPPEEVLTAPQHDFVREAGQLALHGEYIEAAHRVLLSTLRLLAQRKHIPLQAEDGNRAICDKLAASKLEPRLRDQLIALITQTERVWFGAESSLPSPDVSQALYERWLEAHLQLTRAVAS